MKFNWFGWFKTKPAIEKKAVFNDLTPFTCIHESGHFIMAWMFQDHYKILCINADQELTGPDMGAYLHIDPIGEVETIEEADMYMLITQGGIAAATIWDKGPDNVEVWLERFRAKPELMNTVGADGDYDRMKRRAAKLSRTFELTRDTVIWNGFEHVFKFMLEPEVWKAVRLIAMALNTSPNKQLTIAEMEAVLKEQTDITRLQEIKDSFRDKRYPLSKDILSYFDEF